MTDTSLYEAEPQFTQPWRQITLMLLALAAVGALTYLGLDQISAIFMSNPYLNGVILGVFVLGVLSTFAQVIQLVRAVQWIEGFAANRVGHKLTQAPGLLTPLATLLRSRGARMQISSSSSRSILETVGQRIDEDREITRYIGNVLIFLGLLGTFYGLATTVPALVETIRSLNPGEGESITEVFGRLQQGLESQLGGMGTAFASSLLGLAGSLVVGLLELFASHGQNRFYRALEEWLSTITRLGFATGDDAGEGGDAAVLTQLAEHLAEQMESLHMMFTQSDIARAQVDDQLAKLTQAVVQMGTTGGMGEGADNALLERVAQGQEELIAQLKDGGADGLDAESRMRLRSIDVQLLRILEEIGAGRTEAIADLRNDLAALTRAIEGRR